MSSLSSTFPSTSAAANLTDEAILQLMQAAPTSTQISPLLKILIDRYQNKLAHYLFFIIPDRAITADIIQATFIKVYTHLHQFNPQQKFSSWLYRIAHNEAINHIRKHKNFLSAESAELFFTVAPDQTPDLSAQLELQESHQELTQALNQLALKYREPLILNFFQNKSYEEIAQILHLNKNLVGVRIKRAKEQLKSILTSSARPVTN